MEKKPIVNLLVWCDYADNYQNRFNIIRTFSFWECETLPCDFTASVPLQIIFDDLQPPQLLSIKMSDYEGNKVLDEEVLLTPKRTLTDKWVAQYILRFQNVQLSKVDYILEISCKDSKEVIASLPLPVCVAK